MSTRNSRGSSEAVSPDSTPGASALTLMADLPRRQLALLSQSASALYRGTETVRQIQQETAQRASEQHQQAAERLRESRDFGEVMAIQGELLRFSLQETAHYWQGMATALLKLQSEMISGAAAAGVDATAGGEPTLDSLQRAFAATLNGGAPAQSAPH